MSITPFHAAILELSVTLTVLAGLVALFLASRRLRRWTVILALPVMYSFAVAACWAIIETAHLRSWATKPGAALNADSLEPSRVGDYRVELHKGQPVVSFTTQSTTRRGVEQQHFRFFSVPVWNARTAVTQVGPIVAVVLAVLYLLVPRRARKRDANGLPPGTTERRCSGQDRLDSLRRVAGSIDDPSFQPRE